MSRRKQKRAQPTPRVALSLAEAKALAIEWYGPHADVFEPSEADGIDTFCVGHWDHALPTDDGAPDEAFPDLHVTGQGRTIAAAFRDSDSKRWSAYCIRRRVLSAARRT